MTKLKLKGNSKSFKKTASSINRRELNTAMSEMTSCNSGINPIKGYISLPSFNSTTGQKEDFYGLYISDGELTVDTVTNVKEQINSFCTGGGSSGPQALRLTFDSIENANALVGDASNVADWNTFFDLPTYGNPFAIVVILGNEVRLFGGSNITLKNDLFYQNSNILEVIDDAGSVTYLGGGCFSVATSLTKISFPSATNSSFSAFYNCQALYDVNLPVLTFIGNNFFYQCYSLTTINLPSVTTAGGACFYYCTALTTVNLPSLTTADLGFFQGCTSLVTIDIPNLTTFGVQFFIGCENLTTINLPSCTNLGGTVGDDGVFFDIIGNTITLTVPSALMTADAGNPDGDIVFLQANNTVTVVTV